MSGLSSTGCGKAGVASMGVMHPPRALPGYVGGAFHNPMRRNLRGASRRDDDHRSHAEKESFSASVQDETDGGKAVPNVRANRSMSLLDSTVVSGRRFGAKKLLSSLFWLPAALRLGIDCLDRCDSASAPRRFPTQPGLVMGPRRRANKLDPVPPQPLQKKA